MRHLTGGCSGETSTDDAPPLGRFYEVGGRRLLLHQEGSGSPAVVFLPGGGAVGLDYWNVQDQAARFTTSVVYDQAGTGWSDPVDHTRTGREVIDELRALLRLASVPAPYVLVGHSLGGLYARLYATRFPDEIAGLLLIEPDHEEYDNYLPRQLVEMRKAFDPDQALPDALPDELVQMYRGLLGQEMADWPAEIREPLVERHVSPAWIRAGMQVAKCRDQLHDELRAAGPLADVPLIVLTATGIDAFKRAVSVGEDESLLREEIDGKTRLYAAMAASVPRGENRLVDGVGHVTLHWRRPDVVLQAIRDLLVGGKASPG
jgi:pimeloyl-ACP methyl ester carboxylesterase